AALPATLASATLALALAVARHLDRAGDGVTAAQTVPTDHVHGHVDVVRPGEVTGRADERVVVQHVEDAGDRLEDVVLPHLGLALDRASPTTIAFAAATAATTAAPAVVVTVGTVVAGTVVPALVGLVVAGATLLVAIALIVATATLL